MGLTKPTAPAKYTRAILNAMIDYLGGETSDSQIDATKILLAQAGSLLSTWRHTSDLSKIDAAKLLGDIAAARMQTNILAAIIAAGGIVDANVNAAAGIGKSKISTVSTWPLTDMPLIKACRVRNSVAQSLANNTDTFLTFDTEDFDNDSMHSTASNTDRITIQTAGLYFVLGHILFDTNATGVRKLSIYVNGALYEIQQVSAGSAYETGLNVSAFRNCIATDYFQAQAFQNSGGALNAIAGYTNLQAFRIGAYS